MYEVGQILSLSTPEDEVFQVLVQSIPAEFTCSAVMVVDVIPSLSPSITDWLPRRAFLKLFDRRFANNFRDQDWSPELEREVMTISRSGDADTLLEEIRAAEYEDRDLSVGWKEVAAWESLWDDFDHEVAAYDAMRDQQGHLVPELYTRVAYVFAPRDSGWLGESPELFTAPGLLMEHVEGFRMDRLTENVDRSEWEDYIAAATSAIEGLHESSQVEHLDCGPQNVLVGEGMAGMVRFVIVDWASSRLRRQDETDEMWAEKMASEGPQIIFADFMHDLIPPDGWADNIEDYYL